MTSEIRMAIVQIIIDQECWTLVPYECQVTEYSLYRRHGQLAFRNSATGELTEIEV